jgi:serine protease
MKSQRVIAAIVALLGVAQGARVKRSVAKQSVSTRSIAGVPVHNYRANAQEWMILFRQGTTDSSLKSICQGRCTLMGHPSEGGTAFAKVFGSEQQVEELIRQNADDLEFVEPDTVDYLVPEEDVASDKTAAATASWGLERTGVPGRAGTGQGVHIYVQDTGVRGSHNDFGGRVIPTIDLTSGSLVECGGSASCAGDRQGHGTHCAGTAAGISYGVASGATIHAVKTLSDQGSGARSWQHSAIDWITASGATPAVISMSLGGSGADPLYTTSIGAATAKGITVVVAAGNSNSDSCNFSPAFAADAITVGATASDNRRASYSNYGSCNNIMAPGSAIVSASASSDTGSRSLSGTSMACPHVSGGAALLLESNAGLNRDAILASMAASARVGFIGGLKANDPDLFLWVGKDPAPAPAPTPEPLRCPEWSRYPEPDSDGDCGCPSGQVCSRDGGATINCPSSAGVGGWGGRYFSPTCSDCMCY